MSGLKVARVILFTARMDAMSAFYGKVLGLLANGKVNAERLLYLVREGLEGRYSLRDVVTVTKPSATRVATPENLEALGRCDAVVTAIGD